MNIYESHFDRAIVHHDFFGGDISDSYPLLKFNAHIGVGISFSSVVLQEGNIQSIMLETNNCLQRPTHHHVHKSVNFSLEIA